MRINKELLKYIKKEIFPIYNKNDPGHSISHVRFVIKRCFELNRVFKLNLNVNMFYAAASFHDIGSHINRERHEEISAEWFFKDSFMKSYFTQADLKTVKEAIEDHRASLEYEPHSIYGKLLSSADRNISLNTLLKRVHIFTINHYNLNLQEQLQRDYNHVKNKFGKDGYAKMYFRDKKYLAYLNKVQKLLENKKAFDARLCKVNNIKLT